MLSKIIYSVIVIFLVALSFYAGAKWRERTLGELPKVKLKLPLEIQLSVGQKGQIPSGVTLYKFRELPEITTYFMFVNIKETNIFNKIGEGENKYNLISPVDAYPIR